MHKVLDLSCFSFLSALDVLLIERLPQANAGTAVLDMFGEATPDGPIVALLASYLGLKVGLMGNNVGDDARGQKIVDVLNQFHISSTITMQRDLCTPKTIVLCDQEQNRTWFSFLPHGLEGLLSVNLDLIAISKLVYVDLYAIMRSASRRAIVTASQHAVPLFVNLGGDELEEQDVALLRHTNVAIIQTSLDAHSQRKPDDYAKELLDLIEPEIVIVTLAESGLIYATQSEVRHLRAYSLATLHSCGAGAAFSAGFACAYLQGWARETSLRFASALGGLYCTVKNGFGQFSLQYVLDFLKEQEANNEKDSSMT